MPTTLYPQPFEEVLVAPDAPIREVLRCIDSASTQLALVVDDERRLLGTVTDGDIRRGLLAELTLESPIKTCMHANPVVIPSGLGEAEAILALQGRGVRHAPLVDAQGRVVGLRVLGETSNVPKRDNPVVLMAGGLGSRLGELTRHTPKPMLPIGGRPILEHIMLRMARQGFWNFFLAVNYRAEIIERHFGDGSQFGCSVRYLREPQRLGTAGALSLLPIESDLPVLVANGDLLTSIDYGALLQHHEDVGAWGTMAVRSHDVQVPYGVIEAAGDRFVGVREKPVFQHTIATGIYVLSPMAIRNVPADSFVDMPDVFRALLDRNVIASVYRMSDYWIDIGLPPDLERASEDFDKGLG